eukprot:Clim_evm12s195 gene=Clim_evmTU12s195
MSRIGAEDLSRVDEGDSENMESSETSCHTYEAKQDSEHLQRSDTNSRRSPAPSSKTHEGSGGSRETTASRTRTTTIKSKDRADEDESRARSKSDPQTADAKRRSEAKPATSSSRNMSTSDQNFRSTSGHDASEMNNDFEEATAQDAEQKEEEEEEEEEAVALMIPTFVQNIFKLVNDPQLDDLICWAKDGKSVVIYDQNRFVQDFLPTHFRHRRMASFIRQLNLYGFHKFSSPEILRALERENINIRTSNPSFTSWAKLLVFQHENFIKGNPQLATKIKRKQRKKPPKSGTANRITSDNDGQGNASGEGGKAGTWSTPSSSVPRKLSEAKSHHVLAVTQQEQHIPSNMNQQFLSLPPQQQVNNQQVMQPVNPTMFMQFPHFQQVQAVMPGQVQPQPMLVAIMPQHGQLPGSMYYVHSPAGSNHLYQAHSVQSNMPDHPAHRQHAQHPAAQPVQQQHQHQYSMQHPHHMQHHQQTGQFPA